MAANFKGMDLPNQIPESMQDKTTKTILSDLLPSHYQTSKFDFKKIKEYKHPHDLCDGRTSIVKNLENEVDLKSLLIHPNIDDSKYIPTQIMKIINVNGIAASLSSIGTTIIEQGTIGIILHNGNVEVAGPGRWMSLNPRASWKQFSKLTDPVIKYESLTIVRINKGSYGLATENGKPLILAEGLHVRNSRLFSFDKQILANTEHIQNGTINIIRIPAGMYGRVLENNIPKLLEPGNYAIDSNYFFFEGNVSIDSDIINYKTIHVIRVPKSSLTFCMVNNKPLMLNEGIHTFNTCQFRLDATQPVTSEMLRYSTISRFFVKQGMIIKAWHESKPIFISTPGIYEYDDPNFVLVEGISATTKLISLGSRTRFIIHAGEIGLALENNVGKFFDIPGIYEIDDPTFIYKDCLPISTQKITVGSKTRIIVRDGEVAESYLMGKLDILKPGTHNFDSNDRIFKSFIPMTQQCVDLCDEKNDFLTFDTTELVPIGIKAEVFYTIEDPKKATINVGEGNMIRKLIKDTSISTLNSIIRSTPLNKVAKSKVVNTKGEQKDNNDPFVKCSEPLFFDQVHDEFIAKLHDTFMSQYGLNVANIRIADFEIKNKQLVDNISQQALTTAKTETERLNIASNREILFAKEQQAAQVIGIKAQSEADKLKTDTEAKTKSSILLAETAARETVIRIGSAADADASRIIKMAEAEAKAIEIRAVAEARAYELKAAAEAKAIEMKALAEKKRAEALSSTELGGKLAMMTIQGETAAKCFEKTSKMILAMPTGSNMSTIASQLFGVPGVPTIGNLPITAWGEDSQSQTSSSSAVIKS